MKKRINLNLLLSIVVCLIPFVMSVVFYERLPEQVAIHFSINGAPDNYMPKIFVALWLPLIMLCIHVLVVFMSENDPRKENTPRVPRHILKWLVPITSVMIQTGLLTYAVGITFNWIFYVSLFIGILITILGNYLPKCRQNYTIGIKIPWTLCDENNWNKTHRVAGYVWMLGGAALVINAFWGSVWLICAVAVVLVAVPIVYSYRLYKRTQKSQR